MRAFKHLALVAALTSLTSCENQSAANQSNSSAQELPAREAATESGRNAAAGSESGVSGGSGMFRWASGMQMGTYWAAVTNKNDDWLRFFAESDDTEGSSLSWAPSAEIADPGMRSKIANGNVMNFVSGDAVAVFGYEVGGDGEIEIQLLGSDGASNLSRVLEMLRNGSGRPICVEFPKADYRTCFSTSGAQDALS